jgi:hypothetical protein
MWQDRIRFDSLQILDEYVPFEEIIKRIRPECQVEILSTKDIPHIRMHRFNAFHLPINEERLKIAESELQIKGIKLPICSWTEHYIKRNFVPEEDGSIYLAYEESVGYAYSNSSKLFLEVMISRGVTKKSVEEKDDEYHDYIGYVEHYMELYQC